MISKELHWLGMEAQRTPAGLPAGAFDFISVHKNCRSNRGPDSQGEITFRLISPMCIVDSLGGKRPDFENLEFSKFYEACNAAEKFAKLYSKQINRKIFVVDCTD